MYCPRCGSPNTDTTKFCRQCGLPLTQLSGYIATGGTGALTPVESRGGSLIDKATEGLTHKQRLILSILLWVFSPAIMAVFSEALGLKFIENFIPLVAIMCPVGIVWSVFRYKAKMRLIEAQSAQYPQPQPIPGAYQQPALGQPPYRPPIESPPTNPLDVRNRDRGSVTEDETRHLPK